MFKTLRALFSRARAAEVAAAFSVYAAEVEKAFATCSAEVTDALSGDRARSPKTGAVLTPEALEAERREAAGLSFPEAAFRR